MGKWEFSMESPSFSFLTKLFELPLRETGQHFKTIGHQLFLWSSTFCPNLIQHTLFIKLKGKNLIVSVFFVVFLKNPFIPNND